MIKCSPTKGGYAATVCNALLSVAEIFPTKRSKGIYKHSIKNISENKDLGTMIKIKQGEHLTEGLVFNFCPFCGGKVRDTSKDGK